jgi:hypothetical protein
MAAGSYTVGSAWPYTSRLQRRMPLPTLLAPALLLLLLHSLP